MDILSSCRFLIIFSIFWSACSAQTCGKYCVCSLESTECYFDYSKDGSCLGTVPLKETFILKIHGPVCDRVRNVLKKESIFANTIVILFDDICGGIRNCR